MARYGNRYGSRPRSTRGSRWMDLRYAGICKVCGDSVPQGGRGFYDADARTITCTKLECAKADGLTEQVWHGSPVSGGYVEVLRASGIRIGAPAPVAFSRPRSREPRVFTIVTNSGAVLTSCKCEDRPCCGH